MSNKHSLTNITQISGRINRRENNQAKLLQSPVVNNARGLVCLDFVERYENIVINNSLIRTFYHVGESSRDRDSIERTGATHRRWFTSIPEGGCEKHGPVRGRPLPAGLGTRARWPHAHREGQYGWLGQLAEGRGLPGSNARELLYRSGGRGRDRRGRLCAACSWA